ncbi:Chromosome segregation ATPase-like protein [Halalkalicoccus jeotgali B3]|uniref:Chromosome segregation ATPase-like protein n=1 Tax=Halalkalicoccus jeotgali (strain DSM 18796 / CECT 7217 / JCM 14584 / KCTC 4019 / B3) TaxID=795797 RepID=D8J931_HALJB|nr:Chromosome segregation ATPase-like protein [Halalkalicoccus jeotgali B3]ELY37034.1 Chromosome segregation ATPase-like protein [Halalkalicoccus jeotgali B3]
MNVNEGDGTTISDADVTVSQDGTEIDSASSDSASFDLEDGTYTVTVEDENFVNTQQEITIDGADDTREIVLGEYGVDQGTAFQGSDVTATVAEGDTVELRSGDADENSFVSQFNNDDGTVTIDTSDLEGDYVLRVNDEDIESTEFEVAEQTLDAQWSSDSVVRGDSADLELDSNRQGYDIELTSEELDATEIQSLFGDDVTVSTDEDGNDVAQVEDISSSESLTANFADDADVGNVSITASATDTTAEDNATISVEEQGDADISFDSSTYSEEAGDIVEFTVEMDNTDNGVVTIEEDGGNYWADLYVEPAEGEDEVTVQFNTYQAGHSDGSAFSTENDDANVDVIDERSLDAGDDTYRLLPGDFDMGVHLTGAQDSDNVPQLGDAGDYEGDNPERVDTDSLDEVGVATLVLNDRSTGDATVGTAPADVDLEDVETINNETTVADEIAKDDKAVVQFDASGVFGYLSEWTNENGILDLSSLEEDENLDVALNINQTNPAQYESGERLTGEDVTIVTDAENNRIFAVLDTSENNIEAGDEYDASLTIDGENYVSSYSDSDDNEVSDTSFSVVERNIEVTGDFEGDDDEEVLQVENGEEANITGESNAAPGTDVQIRLRATGDNPFLETQTAEVGEDGDIDASFDLSDYDEGQNFTVRMTDDSGAEDVQDEVNAVLVEDVGQPHSVTVTVEDADGNAVSGADVSVADQTETTDDDGQVTFELWHGEYDVTATHDGEETTGTLTINDEDDTTDEGTLVLGEENENINDGDDQNQDDNNNDDQNQDDNNNDDRNNDDNNNDDRNNDDNNQGGSDDGSDGGDSSNDGDGSDDDGDSEDQPGFGIAVALIALLAAAGIAMRNRA